MNIQNALEHAKILIGLRSIGSQDYLDAASDFVIDILDGLVMEVERLTSDNSYLASEIVRLSSEKQELTLKHWKNA